MNAPRTDRIELAGSTLTRVSYLDITVPAELLGLDVGSVAKVSWADEPWVKGDQIGVGAAAWFADIAGQRLVFDPLLAADYALRSDREAEFTHQQAVADAFAAAGMPRESVDLLVLSHIDGVGMAVWREAEGSLSPFFPNASVLMSDREFAMISKRLAAPASVGDLEHEAFSALLAKTRIQTFTDGETIAPGLVARWTGGHGPGHCVFSFTNAAEPTAEVMMLGHMAVSPLHLVSGPCEPLNEDPAVAWSTLQMLLTEDRTLIGPLWPTPGFGRWQADTRTVAAGTQNEHAG